MKEENKKKKGVEPMESINKPREAMMITQGMTKSFINLLIAQNHSKTYWKECLSTKRNVPSSTMDKLKEMCGGEE